MTSWSKPDESVMAYLTGNGFKVKSYLRYTDHSDIIGQFKSPPPFSVPINTFVEVSTGAPNADAIDGLYNQARNAECTTIVLVVEDIHKLPLGGSALASKLGILLWDQNNLVLGPGTNLGEASRTLEAVSTSGLIRALPDLAKQIIPQHVSSAINDPSTQAWEVFEDAVYAAFKSGFGYKVKKYGKESLFESEPEGLVVTNGLPIDRFAFIYDCKSAHDKYTVDSQDESKYIEYIQNKKRDSLFAEHCELKYFLIIGPDFGGDMMLRRQRILNSTQVLTVYLKASNLKILSEWVMGINDPQIKVLVNLREIIKLENPEIDLETIRTYMSQFEANYRPRY